MEETRKRRWGDRRDGYWIRDLDALHVFMPYLLRNRADSEAFISEQIDLSGINSYLERKMRKIRNINIRCSTFLRLPF